MFLWYHTDMPLPQLPPAQQKLARTLKHSKHREAEGLFLVEGMTVIEEAVASGLELEWVASTPGGRNRYPTVSALKALQYDSPGLQMISALQSVPDVAALFRLPKLKSFDYTKPVIYLDGIADPGNLGTMLRTGAWFGVTQWLLKEGGCDPYNPKVVRSAMGSLFRSTFAVSSNPLAELTALVKRKYTLLATTPTGGAAPAEATLPYCLMIGQEAHGLDPKMQQLASTTFSIPGSGAMESLNAAVAFGIIINTVHPHHALRPKA